MGIFDSFRKRKISGEDSSRRERYTSDRWQVGDRIANRYEIYQILGGGMGIVYICYDHESRTPCALKTFQGRYLFSEEAQKLFEREALIWTELERYPYIVRAYSVNRLEGRLFIILEYVAPDREGRNTLTHYLGNLTLPEILKFSIQFCYGMEYAYSKGIDAHRDIKPDNIMITSDKTVKITDFGLAKPFQEIELKEDIISKESPGLSIFKSKGKRICGTLPYMAPEQFDGYANRRSDIYSFGIVLYQMISKGRVPFIGRSPQEYERMHKYEKVPVISSPLFPIIQKCLEKKPDKRFQDFATIREELQSFLLKETGETITPPKIEDLEAWELNNKGVALVNLGRDKEAITCYDEAIRINPGDALVWTNKGVALGSLGRYKEEITCYDEAIRINPGYAKAWTNKGVALDNLGRYKEAITCYDEAIRINPGDALAWCGKGIVLCKIGRYKESITCYDEAIRINPGDAEAWFGKGVALGSLGRYKEALKCAEEAIRLNPNLPQARQLKQLILEKLRR